MVQQENSSTMGEERTSTCAEKKNYEVVSSCRHRHSSVISSCSEDAESESTSAGYPSTQDEERDEEFEYGPGIVSKLKTRYLSIALKQNRGTNMRRSCSMENLLDQDRSPKVNGVDLRLAVNGVGNGVKSESAIGNLKRAKSMDTLLMDLNPTSVKELMNGDDKKVPKIIRKVDGGLNRTVPMICDEELPKPDTVKTYKRMFEPAESRRGSHCRRPPVLRASAKSSALAASKNNGILSSQSAKVNGTSLKNKLSAKQPPAVKAQSNVSAVNGINGVAKKPCVKDLTRPAYNGCHVVKASPVKLISSPLENKNMEKELNNKNLLLNIRDIHVPSKPDVICNGSLKHKDNSKIIPDKITNSIKESNGIINSKPKVPPNKPSLKPPKILPKVHLENGVKELPSKIKPSSINGYLKAPEPIKKESNPIQESKIKEEKQILAENKIVEEYKPHEVSKIKNGLDCKQTNGFVTDKSPPSICDIPTLDKPAQEMKIDAVQVTPDNQKISAKTETVDTPVKIEPKPVKKLAPSPPSTSMVFDFRGKDVVPHVAVLPTPFGCKSLHPKKRPILIDGKTAPNGNGVATDDEDEDFVDYSVPPPSGVIFEGENIKIGRGSILSTRNKDLKITFDDDTDNNTFVYPSESSLLEDSDRSASPTSSANEVIPNDQPPPTPPKLKANTVIGSSGPGSGLSTYTPSVLRTMDNFEPGMFRQPPAPILPEKEEENKKEAEEEEENTNIRTEEDPEMLKPADPDIISSWSLSAGTSDLLF
ncbi:uncharacterized protein [Parasteatoda tepidariorum]|uniref:uncharacterized protein n=1 Tax=Parasteatoda tepidariorum TaxID=114398 RepID=UPI001C729180|nr:uncharacterized protein LOC107456361 [Parasteatoda tepidariorum]